MSYFFSFFFTHLHCVDLVFDSQIVPPLKLERRVKKCISTRHIEDENILWIPSRYSGVIDDLLVRSLDAGPTPSPRDDGEVAGCRRRRAVKSERRGSSRIRRLPQVSHGLIKGKN